MVKELKNRSLLFAILFSTVMAAKPHHNHSLTPQKKRGEKNGKKKKRVEVRII